MSSTDEIGLIGNDISEIGDVDRVIKVIKDFTTEACS
jgi:hypothetical protein